MSRTIRNAPYCLMEYPKYRRDCRAKMTILTTANPYLPGIDGYNDVWGRYKKRHEKRMQAKLHRREKRLHTKLNIRENGYRLSLGKLVQID